MSYFNHERLIPIHGYTGDFATFAKLFKDGKLVFGDYWYHLEVGGSYAKESTYKSIHVLV